VRAIFKGPLAQRAHLIINEVEDALGMGAPSRFSVPIQPASCRRHPDDLVAFADAPQAISLRSRDLPDTRTSNPSLVADAIKDCSRRGEIVFTGLRIGRRF
jgi:hypothetical protein